MFIHITNVEDSSFLGKELEAQDVLRCWVVYVFLLNVFFMTPDIIDQAVVITMPTAFT